MTSFSLVFVWAYVEQAAIYKKTNVHTILVIKVFCDMLEDHGKEKRENRWSKKAALFHASCDSEGPRNFG